MLSVQVIFKQLAEQLEIFDKQQLCSNSFRISKVLNAFLSNDIDYFQKIDSNTLIKLIKEDIDEINDSIECHRNAEIFWRFVIDEKINMSPADVELFMNWMEQKQNKPTKKESDEFLRLLDIIKKLIDNIKQYQNT